MAQVAEQLTVRDEIRSTGHWELVFRPLAFEREALSFDELEHLVSNKKVTLRGWDFPHTDPEAGLEFGPDWVSSETDWHETVEYWRFYRSGQFVHLSALREDLWLDEGREALIDAPSLCSLRRQVQGEPFLDLEGALYRVTELALFAAAAAQYAAFGAGAHFTAELHNTSGRSLFLWRPPLHSVMSDYRAKRRTIRVETARSGLDLRIGAREVALDLAEELLAHFGWTHGRRVLASSQARLLERRL